jgi:hypothetical protein
MAFTQDSIAKQPTVNDIWGTQSNGSTSTNDSNKTIATQGASTTVSPYLQRPSHNPRLENFGNSIANTNNTTNSWNNNNTTSSNSSLPKLLASTTGPKQSSVPDNLEKFPTIVDDTKENVDWSQQIPGIINELLSGVLNNIGDKDKEFNPNAYDLASLWFGDTIANTPNVSRAYTDTINQFLSGVNQRTNSANTLLNDIMQQYSNLGAGAEQNFVNLANLGLAQGSDIEQMISQLGPEFTQLLNQQQGEYSNLKDRSDVIGQVLAGARDKVGGTADTVTQNILDAYQSVLTGQVPEVSKDNINEVFKNNMDLINQSFDDTMTRERRQLVDQMAGRGILTSGVTGRAYGDIVDSALREKQKSMSEIASQRASAMLEMPFRQAQQANALNDHVNTLNTLTNSQATELMDMLQTQYGMSKENAELAINNMVNKYNQESQAMQLQNQLYSVLTGYDTNYQANQLNNTAQQAAFGNQNLQLQQAIAQSAPLHANVNNNPRWKTPSEDEVKGMLGAENLAEYASKGLDVDSIVRTAQSVVSQQNAFKAYQEDMAKIGAVKNGDKGWKSFAEWSLGKAPVSRKERKDGAGVPANIPNSFQQQVAGKLGDVTLVEAGGVPGMHGTTSLPKGEFVKRDETESAEPAADNRVAHDSDTPFGPHITPQPASPVTSIGSGNGAKSRFSKLSNEDLSLIVASPEIKREHRAEAMKEMNTRIQNVAIFNKEDPSLLNGISIQDVTNFAKEFYNASTETYDISLGVLLGTLVGSKAFNFAAKDYQSLVSQLGGPQAIALATQAMFKLSVNDKKTFESISNYIKPALKKITGHTNKLNNLYKSTADPTKVGSKTISSVNPHVLNKSYNKALLDLERRSGAIKHLLSDSNLLQKYTQLKAAGRKVMLDQLGKIPYSNIDHVETILLDPKYMRFLDYVKTIMQ